MKKDKHITAKVIAHSVNESGDEVICIEHEHPRIIHSEWLRHREFSNAVSSSRAIPAKTMRKNIRNKMFIPWYWGKEQKGMQAHKEVHPNIKRIARISWIINGYINLGFSWWYSFLGLHKQLANRNCEYISYVKCLSQGNTFNNMIKLRLHPDAQPEFQELAYQIKEVVSKSNPELLKNGEWHTPYVTLPREQFGKYKGSYVFSSNCTLEHFKQISVSCCAQTSYRTSDTSIEKAKSIYNKLIGSDVLHASPFEFVCTPGNSGKGNLKGWNQMRHQIEEELKK
jgi:hypothetical protein